MGWYLVYGMVFNILDSVYYMGWCLIHGMVFNIWDGV